MSGDIHAMPEVVWPREAAELLARRAGELADLIARQKWERTNLTEQARQDWTGKARTTFDTQHEGATVSVADNAVENLYAIERVLREVADWVVRENAARRDARQREHDDTTWGGLKKYWNAIFE